MDLYRYIFEIEVPDKDEEQRIIEYQKFVIDKLTESNKRLRAENKQLKEERAFMEWD